MKKIVLILVLAFAGWHVQAQNIDSLYHLFTEAKGSKRITLINEIAQAVYTQEGTDTLFHIANNAKPELVEAVANEVMASYAVYRLNDLSKAVKFSIDAAHQYEQIGDISAMDKNYSNAAIYYYRMGDYEKAIDLMLKCYELEIQLDRLQALSTTLNNLGIAYSNWGKSELAIEYFRRALEVERPLNRPMQYAGRLSSLAKETALLGNYDEALRLIREAFVYNEKLEGIQREDRMATHHIIMGDIYVAADSLLQAEKCYQYAVSVFEKINRQQLLASSLLGLGRLQVRQKRFAEAIETLKNCLTISEKNNLQRIQRDANRFMYEAYKQRGNATQALFHLEQYRDLNDLIYNETTQKQFTEFQIKYETAEKELEIAQQKAEINRSRTRLLFVTGGLIAVGLLLLLSLYTVVLRTKRNRELAESNATKDKFFTIISHDLKNPAVAQRDAIQMLFEHSGLWDADLLRKYYQGLLHSANNQVDLLYNLLNWAQVQTGRMPYAPVVFDVAAALRSDIALVKNMAERKEIMFHLDMDKPVIVYGDENMITTVVRNLLANAIKFTSTGGEVLLRIEPSKEVSLSNDDKYTVSVVDTGIGITSEQLQSLFRIETKRSLQRGTAGESGSGLGLMVCRELLQKHGSELHVESQEGKGSWFWFEI